MNELLPNIKLAAGAAVAAIPPLNPVPLPCGADTQHNGRPSWPDGHWGFALGLETDLASEAFAASMPIPDCGTGMTIEQPKCQGTTW
jgi:hypothetical protein